MMSYIIKDCPKKTCYMSKRNCAFPVRCDRLCMYFFLYPSLFTLGTAIRSIGSSLPRLVSFNPQRRRIDSSGFEYCQMFSIMQN